MNILFLHPNFPGQFRNLVKYFADGDHDVRFICQTHYNRKIAKVVRYCIKGELGDEELKKVTRDSISRASKLASQYEKALKLLKKEWKPEIVISHSGWGCGTYVKTIWPETKHIAYSEWWFNPNSSLFNYDPENEYLGISKSSISKQWPRNSLQALELVCADLIVSPTSWQKSQLPKILQENCVVIYDGIDINKFNPLPKRKKSGVITYGTRGMEPMRCFPQFIKALPKVLSHTKTHTVEIAGLDEINYAGKKPGDKTWKEWAVAYLEKNLILDRVKWVGRLPEKEYIRWLQNSECHIYLTHPYVASWSLVEAIFCGCCIVASDVEPVQEFYIDSQMLLVDHRNIDEISKGIIKTISSRQSVTNDTPRKILAHMASNHALHQWDAVSNEDLTTFD